MKTCNYTLNPLDATGLGRQGRCSSAMRSAIFGASGPFILLLLATLFPGCTKMELDIQFAGSGSGFNGEYQMADSIWNGGVLAEPAVIHHPTRVYHYDTDTIGFFDIGDMTGRYVRGILSGNSITFSHSVSGHSISGTGWIDGNTLTYDIVYMPYNSTNGYRRCKGRGSR